MVFSYPDEFRRRMLNGTQQDHPWTWPAQHYVNIYYDIRHKEDRNRTACNRAGPTGAAEDIVPDS